MIQMREVMTVGSLAEKASKLDPVPPKGTKYSGSSWAVQDAEVGQFDMKMMDKQILEVGAGRGWVVGVPVLGGGGACMGWCGACWGWWGCVGWGCLYLVVGMSCVLHEALNMLVLEVV
jgi:hypothetical protein